MSVGPGMGSGRVGEVGRGNGGRGGRDAGDWDWEGPGGVRGFAGGVGDELGLCLELCLDSCGFLDF